MTQTTAILNHLRQRPITPLEALEQFGCFRLAARVMELRRSGHNIVAVNVEQNGKRFAQYRLEVT